MDDFLGEIKIFAGTYAPLNWAYCNGQLLNISQNTALYSVIGTTYGGNGTTNFALPNLQGRAPVGMGAGLGLTARQIGEIGGADNYTINTASMPAHSHTLNGSSDLINNENPTNAYNASILQSRTSKTKYNKTVGPDGTLDPASVSPAGGVPASVSTMQPFLAVGYIICLNGNYPQRQ